MTIKKYGGNDFGCTLEELKKLSPLAETIGNVEFHGSARKVSAILTMASVGGELIAEIERLTVAEQRASMLEREFKKLRDVAHGCYEIASSYSGCIDGVEEHGGDDHEDPSCAIHHRLYYAMFDADRALKSAAEVPGSTCNQIREESGLPTKNPCVACNNGACIDR